MEPTGIEPVHPACKTGVLPLYYGPGKQGCPITELPATGLEPVLLTEADFKSTMSTIPSSRLAGKLVRYALDDLRLLG